MCNAVTYIFYNLLPLCLHVGNQQGLTYMKLECRSEIGLDWFQSHCIKGDRQKHGAFMCVCFPQPLPSQQEYPLIHHRLA